MDNMIETLIQTELQKAENKFKPFNSPHEGYAIIKEEVEELEENKEYIDQYLDWLWGYVKNNDIDGQLKMIEFIFVHTENLIKEAIQVAAMAKRYEKDLK